MADSDGFAFRPRKLGYVIVGFVLLYIGFNSIRTARIDALARAAMDRTADPAIVQKLASYRGDHAADLLLLVAGGAPTQENRLVAIHALVERKAAPLVSRLSELLVPQESFAIRMAVAQALYQTACSTECIKNVLYFEERMSNGARPSEDVVSDPPRGLSKPERQLQNVLDEVLKKNKPALGLVLAKVYGLTSEFPSSFAIQVIERLEIKEACPALIHTYLSVDDQVKNSPEYQEVTQAVKILECSTFGMTY